MLLMLSAPRDLGNLTQTSRVSLNVNKKFREIASGTFACCVGIGGEPTYRQVWMLCRVISERSAEDTTSYQHYSIFTKKNARLLQYR